MSWTLEKAKNPHAAGERIWTYVSCVSSRPSQPHGTAVKGNIYFLFDYVKDEALSQPFFLKVLEACPYLPAEVPQIEDVSPSADAQTQ